VPGSRPLSFALLLILPACGGTAKTETSEPVFVHKNSSRAKLTRAAPVEPVDIDIDVQRQGSSLLLTVKGTARGHQSNSVLEDPKRWQVSARLDGEPLKQVLAGPARVSREPTGAALGDQWNVYVSFMVGFAMPGEGKDLLLEVHAPDGEIRKQSVELEKLKVAGR
jgi:hypothetical protein